MMGEQAVIKTEQGEVSRLQMIHQMEGERGLTLTGNSVIEEQTQLQKAEKLLALCAKPPYNAYISFKPESPYYLLFNAIKHYNPVMMDKILATPEEVQQLLRDRQAAQAEQEQMAVEEGKQQSGQAEIQMQMAQLEMQLKQAQLQMDMQKQQADMEMEGARKQQEMKMKEDEHNQKMRQMEEAHQLKMQMAKEESNAKAKALSKTSVNKKP